MSERLTALLLLGPTGSGKTPLGDLLEERGLGGRRCVHFDFGANLRGVAEDGVLPSTGQPPGRLCADDLAVIEAALRTGALLENEQFHIARDLLLSFADQRLVASGDLLVLNGLPRHAGQAGDVDTSVHVERLVVLDCPAEIILQRLERDPGGDRAGRVDDEAELVERKLATFQQKTLPLVRHYAELDIPVQHLQVGAGTVAADLAALL